MPRVIAVANQKGGVGKTATSVNLGAGLALAGRRTLLIDLDPQANTTRALGFERDPDRRTVYDALIEGIPLEQTLLETDLENLTLCPSENELTGAEVELVSMPRREFRILDLVINPHEYGTLQLNIAPTSDVIASSPTLRFWHYRRIQRPGSNGDVLNVPSEVETGILWRAKAEVASVFDPRKFELASIQHETLWKMLRADNSDEQHDWV